MNTYLHVDINSYFATMLQQKYPSLRGRPLGVVKDVGRTCIIAASKEAKLLGVTTGSAVADAQKRAPGLILMPAEFDFYLDSTKRLKTLFESVSPQVDIYSLDEAFINLSLCRRYLHPDPVVLGRRLQSAIGHTLGSWVTANVGISHNRFLAKLASEVSPKGSVTQITPANQDAYLASAPFRDVCGIGLRLEAKLLALGITNLFQLNFVPDADLNRYFGPFWSVQLRLMSQGQEPHFFNFINHLPYPKSIGRSITGFKICHQESDIKAVIYNLVAEVIYKARYLKVAGRQVAISLYGHDQVWRDHLTLNHYLCHTGEMFAYLYHRLYRRWHRSFPVIKFAVRLNLIKPLHQLPLSLLPQWQRQEKIHQALDRLNHRFGLYSVHSGLFLNRQLIRPEVTGFFGDKQFHLGN